MHSIRKFCLAAVAAGGALCGPAAHATDVQWSVGIHAPIGPGVTVGTVISNGHGVPVVAAPVPVVLPAPVYVPSPVYVPPPPVYVPPRVVYAPPVVYARPVAWGAPVWVDGRWVHHRHHRHHHGWYGGYRDGGRDHRGPPQPLPYRPGREIRY